MADSTFLSCDFLRNGRWGRTFATIGLLWAVMVAGCGAEDEPAGVPDESGCTVGLVGCDCGIENFCQSGAYCGADGVCAAVSCELGSENCACFDNATCLDGADGVLLACDAEGVCRQSGASCPAGSEGCACVGGACLGDGLACVEGEAGARCEQSGCVAGEAGCTCPSNWQCAFVDGERLACDGTQCVAPDCELGSAGCFCGARRSCDAGLLCDGDTSRCAAPACIAGTTGCICDAGACDGGATCNLDSECVPAACGEGAVGDEGCLCAAGRCGETAEGGQLSCLGGVCVATESIRVGEPGGACYGNSSCNPSARCERDTYTCVACAPGSTGCACRPSDNGCVNGLACFGGSCVAEESLVRSPPENPVCYSPCGDGMELPDGTYRACSAEGLMVGCLGARTCQNGACLEAGEVRATCATDLNCPDYQTCIEGACYSECEFDMDCSGGLSCSRKVCRIPCIVGDNACGSGLFCASNDGRAGMCMPLRASDPEPVTRTSAAFTIAPTSIPFNNSRLSGSFSLTNDTATTQVFVVRKVGHNEYSDDGLRQIGYVDADGDDLYDDNPLQWVTYGRSGDVRRRQTLELVLEAGETAQIAVSGTSNESLPRWEGVLEVYSAKLGRQRVRLEYSTQPDGQWTGTAFYFMNFDDTDLGNWLADRDDNDLANETNNAFLSKWTNFRTNPRFALQELLALINATVTGNWNFPSVREACSEIFSTGGEKFCYLYVPPTTDAPADPNDGIRIYSANPQTLRIPSGVIEMPFSMNLRANGSGDAFAYEGRLNTAQALQFPGNPPVSMQFASDPGSCARSGESCVTFIRSFDAQSMMGARYTPETPGDCGTTGLAYTPIPWLLAQFADGTTRSEGGLFRGECRENRFPVDPALVRSALEQNASLAAANPIADGRTRVRNIELIDGVYVNQDTLILVVRETFDSYFGDEGGEEGTFSAYGIVSLRRTPAELEPDAYEPGIEPAVTPAPPAGVLALECGRDVIEATIGVDGDLASLSDLQVRALAVGLIGTSTAATSSLEVAGTTSSSYTVNYLCHDTGRFNGGPAAWVSGATGAEACPYGSGVTYFLMSKTGAPNLGTHACQSAGSRCGETGTCSAAQRGTCADLLNEWALEERFGIILDPGYQCLDGLGAVDNNAVVCTPDRQNLRLQKRFYVPSPVLNVEPPLGEAIDRAFRYKTRFRNRSGATVGFVPERCEDGGDALPYCYAPEEIEQVRDRVDCLVALYGTRGDALNSGGPGTSVLPTVRNYLDQSFSFYADVTNPEGLPFDGFERLYAELLIMLGDDAFTRSVASRFDLAGTAIGGFDGDLFEPDGIRLSGGAGYQMRLLYQSMQYHDMVLDRFYRMAPILWQTLGTDRNIVNINTISTYFNRVLVASTRKAQVASEVARQYQAFNRADLARQVLERGYAQTYLESVALSQFVRRAARVVDSRELPAVQVELDTIQRQYRVAMQRMREVYQSLTDELNYFGFAPDYIPFPLLRLNQEDAVSVLIDRALETISVAREREDRALESTRAFDTDAARFQAELVGVRNQYETELSRICGTFSDVTGRVYPAIPKYATVNGIMTLVGNPCGYVGNGNIFEAMLNLERSNLDLKIALRQIEEIFEQADIESRRVEDSCGATLSIEQLEYQRGTEIISVQSEVRRLRDEVEKIQRAVAQIDRQTGIAQGIAQTIQAGVSTVVACTSIVPPNPLGCTGGGVAVAALAVFNLLQVEQYQRIDQVNDSIVDTEEDIREKETEAATLRRSIEFERAIRQCCLDATVDDPTACNEPGPTMVESQARVDTLMVDIQNAELTAFRALLEMQLAQGAIAALRNRADRLIAQQEESEQLLINVEATRNDPNVRIYRNSAILDADMSFEQAVQDAYRATRVYEYYTSTSYARRDELFLARMIARGDYNVDGYVRDLQRAFRDFEELYGLPSDRVHVLSLRDDIFQIPEVAPDGRAYSQAERVDLFRAELLNVDLLDERGAIRIPFNTTVRMTSPLTAIHKITGVEIEVIGSDVGDRVGRVYVTQRGTSTIRTVEDDRLFYRFPRTTAVVNSYFNGVRAFDTEVYRNGRFRDRPFINSLWELGINQRDETVNADINLASLTDVRVYFQYGDFTLLD